MVGQILLYHHKYLKKVKLIVGERSNVSAIRSKVELMERFSIQNHARKI